MRFCRGTEQGCHASSPPVTGWGSQAERPPWGQQEGPRGLLALVQGQDRAENRFSRVSVKDFRVCPVESHWRILGRRVTCPGWVLEARSAASIAANALGWVDLSTETSLEAVEIRQVGDGESGRVVAAGREGWYARMTSGMSHSGESNSGAWVPTSTQAVSLQRQGRLGWDHLPEGQTVNAWTVAHQAPLSVDFSRQEY